MEVDYEVMLELVLIHCNQEYKLNEVPKGLQNIVKMMCEHIKSPQYNIASFNNSKYNESYSELQKNLFKYFSGMLSMYKKVKTL